MTAPTREQIIEAMAFGTAWKWMESPRLSREVAQARWDSWVPTLRAPWLRTAEIAVECIAPLAAIVPREATEESFGEHAAEFPGGSIRAIYAKMVDCIDLSKEPK